MAKYAGKLGFSQYVKRPGTTIWEEDVIERPYTGEVINAQVKYETTADKMHDDLKVNHELSIVADNFAIANSHTIKYATLMGARWKVTGVRINYPRLVLSIGGVYNGPESNEDEAGEARVFVTDYL